MRSYSFLSRAKILLDNGRKQMVPQQGMQRIYQIYHGRGKSCAHHKKGHLLGKAYNNRGVSSQWEDDIYS
jgi:hypothetical protein